jgi:hypothetical protein
VALALGKLTGSQAKILRNAILSAFVNEASMNVFLREELDKPLLDDFTDGNNREQRTFSLIQVAESEGWLTDLVAKLQAYRPNNVLVRNLPDALRLGDANQNKVAPAERVELEKIVRNSGFLDFPTWTERMSQIGQATCRIEVRLGDGSIKYGTGFLLADDLVITNYHVVEDHIVDQKDPKDIVCRFDYAMDVKGIDEGVEVSLVPGSAWLVASSPYDEADILGSGTAAPDHLDFALLRLSRAVGREVIGGKDLHRGRIRLKKPAPEPNANDPVFIVQHPLAKPMVLAIGKVLGLHSNGVRLRYDADTEGGSSGSGVFNERLELVALHHAGDPIAKIAATYNQGIPIGRIAEKLDLLKINLSDTKLPQPVPPQLEASQPVPSQPMPRPTAFRVLASVVGLLVVAVAAWLAWPTSGATQWTTVPGAEVHKAVVVRATASDDAPKLPKELHPGDIEDFGKVPAVRMATIDRRRWYGISLNSIDQEVYFPSEEGSTILLEWKAIEGCLRTKQTQTPTYNATLKDRAADVWPFGVVLPRDSLETAAAAGDVWYRYKNNNRRFRYVRTGDVERLSAANCPT